MEWFIIFVLAVAVIWFGAWKISDAYDKSIARQVRLESDLRHKDVFITTLAREIKLVKVQLEVAQTELKVLEQLNDIEVDIDEKAGSFTIRAKNGEFELHRQVSA